MQPASESTRHLARDWAIVLIVAAAFIFCHPYTGIRHDGTLYAGDALAHLMPTAFRDDLYFFYGSQGRFTLLPTYYAFLISTFGIGRGTMIGLILAFLLYYGAAWYLIATLSPKRWRPFCLIAVCLGWTIYGGSRVFSYSEPFLTARSYAEPAVLVGIAWLLRGRRVWAGVALLIALVVHPLIGLPGCIVAWIHVLRTDRRWIWLGAFGVASIVTLGLIGREPFADVFARYDAQWLDLVHEANGHAFVLRWTGLDYGVVLFDAAVLYFVARLDIGRAPRDLAIAAGIAGLAAIATSLVLVDLVGNPFFGKLQIWRTEWVMQWAAMAMLPLVVAALWRQPGQHGRMAACFLAIGWMAMFTVAPGILAVMAVAVDLARKRTKITAATTRFVIVAAVIIAASISIQYEARVFKLGILLNQSASLIVGQALSMNLLVAILAVGLIVAVPRMRLAAPIVGVALLAVALTFWDQRGAWPRKLESYSAGTHIWQGLVRDDEKVYWYRDLVAPWILLGHGNYYTQQQGSGAVFSRAMVVELDRRRKVTAMLDFQEQICRMMNNLSEKQTSCEPDAEAVRTLCTEGKIDDVVLQSRLEGKKPLADYSTGVIENGYEKRFFLYRCADLNGG